MPMGLPSRPHGQTNMPLHTYRPRQFQWTWFGVNRHISWWVLASARFQEPLSCPWACPLCLLGQMIMLLHIHRPQQSQWTWFRVDRPSGCRLPSSARFQEPLSCPWACSLCPHGQMTMTLHITRIISWAVAEFQHPEDSRSPYHVHYAPMGKWPCRCTPTNQDCSNQIDVEWIGPLVCGVPAFTRFQEPLSCSWACPLCPHGQMTMPLHTYKPRLF